jgi:hypothetical protein
MFINYPAGDYGDGEKSEVRRKTLAKATIERLRDLGSGRRDAIMMDPRIIQIEKEHNPRSYHLKAPNA